MLSLEDIKSLEGLKVFLSKFSLSDDKIDDFISNKEIIVKNNNVFLTVMKFKNNEVFNNGLIFINLEKLLPSTYLLNYIKENTVPIKVKSERQALNFTYSNSLSLDSIEKNQRLKEGLYYIVEYNNSTLGYAKYVESQKHKVVNIMNIGEYLKE